MTLRALLDWHRVRPRLALLIHIPICAALLGTALIAQYVYGYAPCELCLWQRVPYILVIVTALTACLLDRQYTTALLVAIAGLYMLETGLAIHHVGVEHDWWGSAAGCGFQATAADIQELYKKIATAPVVSCSDASWKFIGLSMATWNVIVAAGLAVFTAAQAFVQRGASTSTR